MSIRMEFTKARINAIKPPEPGKRHYYNDTQVQGLQLVVTAAGQMSFYLYAWFQDKPKRFRIGSYPDLTPDMARQLARKMRGEVAQDQNPTAERQRRRAKGVTLREVLEVFRQTRRHLKPRTVNDYQRFLETIFPDWIDRPFVEVTRDKVSARHTQVTETSGPAHANNAMRSLRSLLNFAMNHFEGPNGERLMLENPVAKLSQTRAWNKVRRRETVIAEHQLKGWFTAVFDLKLNAAPDSHEAMVADYLLLLILTGLRRSEGGALTWERVDLVGRTLTLRDTKNRQNHILPLSDYLVELLTLRRRVTPGKYVFPGQGSTGHLVEPRPQMNRITSASGVPFTLHDLRRTFATVAESLDIPAYALKRLLNHKTGQDVTAGYLIITPERLREPMQKITNYFLKASGVKASAKIIRLDVERAK